MTINVKFLDAEFKASCVNIVIATSLILEKFNYNCKQGQYCKTVALVAFIAPQFEAITDCRQRNCLNQ